jgi:hypothetical protein
MPVAQQVVGAAFRAHTSLGPGLLESVYEAALAYELEKRGLSITRQQGIPVVYEAVRIHAGCDRRTHGRSRFSQIAGKGLSAVDCHGGRESTAEVSDAFEVAGSDPGRWIGETVIPHRTDLKPQCRSSSSGRMAGHREVFFSAVHSGAGSHGLGS